MAKSGKLESGAEIVHKQEKRKAVDELKAILTLTYLGIPLETYLLLRGGVDDVSFLPG